jgi:Flp pilus assembly protein TadG
MTPITSVFRRVVRRFRGDESGIALIYATIALPVIIGFGLLAIDVSRLWSLQSSLQHGADALALAGAGELDRRPDSIVRAELAIDNLVANKAIFNSVSTETLVNGTRVTTRYLNAIPGHGMQGTDADPMPSGAGLNVAIPADNIAARFVEVTVTPTSLNTVFPASFLGATNSARASATAVAGFEAAVCNFTPLFMCNPFEPDTGTTDVYSDYGLYAHVALESNRRRLIALKAHDQQWAPGNFGYLEANAGPGAKELANSIASVSPQACFILNNLSTQTGNIESMKKAFNTRFDLYPNGNIGGQSATSFPPAVNVRKGYLIKKKNGNGAPNACDDNNPVSDYNGGNPDYTQAMELPKDSCHIANNCTLAAGRMGNGDWGGDNPNDTLDNPAVPDFYQYWRFNHPGRAIPSEADLGIGIGTSPIPNNNPPSRYAIYRYEIAQNIHTDANANPVVADREVGNPRCNPSIATDNPDRRIIYGAIINCRANGLNGGKTTNLQAVAFGKFFMTQPMTGQNASDTTLWTELVDIVQPGQANSVARDMVQLYR